VLYHLFHTIEDIVDIRDHEEALNIVLLNDVTDNVADKAMEIAWARPKIPVRGPKHS
jgi:hypothetical protein